jgi:hypothetical protein
MLMLMLMLIMMLEPRCAGLPVSLNPQVLSALLQRWKDSFLWSALATVRSNRQAYHLRLATIPNRPTGRNDDTGS